jgi:hypothetical protein
LRRLCAVDETMGIGYMLWVRKYERCTAIIVSGLLGWEHKRNGSD